MVILLRLLRRISFSFSVGKNCRPFIGRYPGPGTVVRSVAGHDSNTWDVQISKASAYSEATIDANRVK
jgi:hypothetical protein